MISLKQVFTGSMYVKLRNAVAARTNRSIRKRRKSERDEGAAMYRAILRRNSHFYGTCTVQAIYYLNANEVRALSSTLFIGVPNVSLPTLII